MKTNEFYAYLQREYGVSPETIKTARRAEADCAAVFPRFDSLAQFNTLKVLRAFQKNGLASSALAYANGYGYNDAARDVLERVYADVFRAEAALCRPQIISGTHALNIALSGNLRHGDTLLCPAGAPYNTLLKAIGAAGEKNSLTDYGVIYKQIDLTRNGGFNFDAIKNALAKKTKMCLIQRSCGYSLRNSFSLPEIKGLVAFIKNISPDTVCLVDNCYGEFADFSEPVEIGADLCAGSLIKNPGGGLAQTGGYILGKRLYVENAADRLTAAGLGAHIGPSLGFAAQTLQGFFLAPHVTGEALKNAAFAARVFELSGFAASPEYGAKRTDIIQRLTFNSLSVLETFIRAIQKAACVDAFVTPEFAETPGYDCEIIMAQGGFVQGASIELSADGPKREPYTAFLQGCQSFAHGKTGVIIAADAVLKSVVPP